MSKTLEEKKADLKAAEQRLNEAKAKVIKANLALFAARIAVRDHDA